MSESNTDLTTQQGGVPVIQEGPGALLAALVSLAQNPNVNPQTVAAWSAIQERLEAREAQRLYNEAFHRMSAVMPRVKKNGVVQYPVNKNQPDGPQKKAFNFAKVEDIDEAIRPILIDHGFHLSFNQEQRTGDGGGVVVIGKLRHTAGHEEIARFALGLDTSGGKSNMQGYASSTSFGQRYCTKLLLNLIFEGDDDNGTKGDQRFITDDQASELQDLIGKAGFEESAWLQRRAGTEIKSVHEVEQQSFVILSNMLRQVIAQRNAKKE